MKSEKLKIVIIFLAGISILLTVYNWFKTPEVKELTICDCVAQEKPGVKKDSTVIKKCLETFNPAFLSPDEQMFIKEEARKCADSLGISIKPAINIETIE